MRLRNIAWGCLECLTKRVQLSSLACFEKRREAEQVKSWRGSFLLQSQWIRYARHSTGDARASTCVSGAKYMSLQCTRRKPLITSCNRVHVWNETWAKNTLFLHKYNYIGVICYMLNSNTGGRHLAKEVFHFRLHYRHSYVKRGSMHLMPPPS